VKIYPTGSSLFQDVDADTVALDSRIEICDMSSLDQDGLKTKDPKTSILVSQDFEPAQVVEALARNKFYSFVQKRESHFMKDLAATAQMLIDPKLYFLQGGRNSLGHIDREFEFKFHCESQKPELKKAIEDFVLQIGSDNVNEAVEAVLEELFMNAMFDAPKEAANQGQGECRYKSGHYSIIRIFQNETRLAVVCEDPFGSLNITKLIDRMDEVYRKGAGTTIRLDNAGGAGLGCVMMFEQCESLYLGVMPGEKTLVTCLIPLGVSNRKRTQMKKSLHLITG